MKTPIQTAAYTGLRWGELAVLRVADLELLQRRLIVRQTATNDRGNVTFGPAP